MLYFLQDKLPFHKIQFIYKIIQSQNNHKEKCCCLSGTLSVHNINIYEKYLYLMYNIYKKVIL